LLKGTCLEQKNISTGAFCKLGVLYNAGPWVTFNDSTYYTVWHSGNDGSGSTLDSDTVDGEHAADIVSLARVSASLATSFNIADDGVTSFTPYAKYGIAILYAISVAVTTYAIINFRIASTSARCVGMVLGADTEVTTGALTGSTGTDGKTTISAHTDGKIYVENRIGASRTLGIIFISKS